MPLTWTLYPFAATTYAGVPTVYLPASGGAVGFGSATLVVTTPTSCPCNPFAYAASGGAVGFGTATFVVDSIGGGAVGFGTATFVVATDPADGFAAWYLLDEDGTGAVGEYKDSTRYHLDGTGGSTTETSPGNAANTPTLVASGGPLCRPYQSTQGRQYVALKPDRLRTAGPITVSLWAQLQNFLVPRVFYARGDGTTWSLTLGHDFLDHLQASVHSDTTTITATGRTQLTRNLWYHLAVVWSPGHSLTVCVNGTLDGSATTTEASLPTPTVNYIARHNQGSMPTARILDVRVYPEVKDSAWLTAEADNSCAAGFYVIGAEAPL